ncbi:unnamed protein product [Clonostachys chloroleuca]|uniref:Dipeptidyl-peptidase V n=1 Tax=Clonostachys chloroleuca TaxID=1926264 RepID=A0AA35LZC2_9HYPO|nr:unnamed protein product [Clonostachys chloroleuca]
MKWPTASWALAALTALPNVLAIDPKGLLAANRYSGALPNPTGEFALFTSTNYSWDAGKSKSVWNVLNLTTGDISVWGPASEISEIVFVGSKPTSILYLNGSNANGDGVSLYTSDVASPDNATLVASLSGDFSGLKAAQTKSGDINFLLYSKAYPNGTAYSEATAVAPRSTARIYEAIYARHWDYWLSEVKQAVFGGALTKNGDGYSYGGNLTNYVTGIHNVTYAESPLDLNGADDYDLSPDGTKIAFLTKDVNLPLANFTSSQIYLVPFDGTAKDAVPINARGSTKYPDAQGASANPRFSPDSTKIAWTQQNGIYYESDRSILYTAKVDGDSFDVTRLAGDWDRSPGLPLWSQDGETIFVDAPDLGRDRVFSVPVTAGDDFKPKNITDEGVVAAFYNLPEGKLLISDSKIWTSRDIYTVSTDGKDVKYLLQANKVDDALAGLGPEDVSEFYYSTNTSEIQQQAWVVYPEGFDKTKKYPLAYIIHGGPQGAHFNSWSTRWNFKVWADQGYVVIAPNPTASSGWGQNLTDAIQGRWGSYPLWDIVHAYEHAKANFDFIDFDRAIQAGASFGGYLTNWVQGHDFGRNFKALVTHDGSTSTLNQYASEELWFMNHDFNGPFNSSGLKPGSPYYDWNPINYVGNWATPHFVVHNDLDFRLPVSEGILLFNLLQVKGVPSKFLNFPDENHWVLNRENSLVWHTEIFKWINYYSGIGNATSPY